MNVTNEYYHVYNRGAHKAPIFQDAQDYYRFVMLLYVANDTMCLKKDWLEQFSWNSSSRTKIVDIFAYCLMPNHYHLGLIEICEGGITRFVRRLCTAYSMYYNNKYHHSGTLFQGKYKAKHIDSDEYFHYLIQYIHLNPYGIEEPELLRSAKPDYFHKAVAYSKEYDYSSFKDYLGISRFERNLLTMIGGPT